MLDAGGDLVDQLVKAGVAITREGGAGDARSAAHATQVDPAHQRGARHHAQLIAGSLNAEGASGAEPDRRGAQELLEEGPLGRASSQR